MERKTEPVVGSVHRALVLLRMIIESSSVGVTEAAAALEVNASTAQRLLATLVHDGFAVQGKDRRYAAGPALHAPGLATRIPQVTDRLRPALEALFERTGETVHLASLVGTRILHLDGIEARHRGLQFGLRVGVWLPAHLTASGKVMLAELDPQELRSRYEQSGKRSDVDLAALSRELETVRQERLARNIEQSEPGVAALAVFVGTFAGEPVSMSVAAPISRYTAERGERWGRDLTEIADIIRSARR